MIWQTCQLPWGVPKAFDILPIYGLQQQQQQKHSASLAQNNLDWSSRHVKYIPGKILQKIELPVFSCICWDIFWSIFSATILARSGGGVHSGLKAVRQSTSVWQESVSVLLLIMRLVQEIVLTGFYIYHDTRKLCNFTFKPGDSVAF